MLSQDELKDVKQYMKVEYDEEDHIISVIYAAAETYLKKAGGVEDANNRDIYILAVWGITLHWFENRNEIGNDSDFPRGLRIIINQLKMCKPSTAAP